jgi:hypothetical protein
MPEDRRRNKGSTIAASVLGIILLVAGILWAITWSFRYRISWVQAEPVIDVGAFWLFGGVLIWWARSAREHKPESSWRIGGSRSA